MFRVKFMSKHREQVLNIAGVSLVCETGNTVTVRDDALRAAYRETGLCGRGIAIFDAPETSDHDTVQESGWRQDPAPHQ